MVMLCAEPLGGKGGAFELFRDVSLEAELAQAFATNLEGDLCRELQNRRRALAVTCSRWEQLDKCGVSCLYGSGMLMA